MGMRAGVDGGTMAMAVTVAAPPRLTMVLVMALTMGCAARGVGLTFLVYCFWDTGHPGRCISRMLRTSVDRVSRECRCGLSATARPLNRRGVAHTPRRAEHWRGATVGIGAGRRLTSKY